MPTSASRPRLVDAAFWCIVGGAVIMIAGGLMTATKTFDAARLAIPAEVSDERVRNYLVVYRSIGYGAVVAGAALAFLAGKARGGDSRFRMATLALAFSLVGVVLLLAVGLGVGQPLILVAALPVLIGAALMTRPSVRAWYERAPEEGAAVTESAAPPESEVLFYEQGASWLWVLAGPGAGIAMALIQLSAGYVQWVIPVVFFLLVTLFLGIQVKAARIHTSVELTAEALRQGTETIRTAEILRVYPEAEGAESPKWQYARALGELTGVPRGRTGIGVRLSNDRTAQAWARKHQLLRAALTNLVEERIPPERAS